MRTRRSTAVGLTVTAMLAMGLTACGQDEEVEAAAVCTDAETGERVDDDQCDDDSFRGVGGGAFLWYFLPIGGRAPAIGSRVTGGTYDRPSGRYALGGVDRGGQTISRGGFGGSSQSGRIGG
ncbi:tRNA-dihydrouridine synthase [Vallicoccus soli]|uniref:tRNA-dihydrouridine synthase n=1 Tax=Vallicoccus soli TaxID=2339232 RepID=A0A3A3ZG56_9ACTN|nr:tRNA-dihydrouridine synthase [Vallicoccus soli]RJK94182.1 tRNA-dihydrouridine synthase [Vallicoccus soli]